MTLWLASASASGLLLAWVSWGSWGSWRRATEAESALARLVADGREVLDLRARVEHETLGASAAAELPARVTGVLASCGLPASTLTSLTTSSSGEGAGLERRQASVSLQVTLPQLGRFLESWRAAEPAWVVSSVDLSPSGPAPAAGGDLQLQVLLTMEALVFGGGE
jgi:hypothetical protein